ncbi:MAG: DUF59 domain-containing protein [Candidatus Magasanikbacteria bacterium]|jgi:metal-sulfur cluster biosynthetic enzyme|nr:DUF59 domain-containing protein [Candidatus Magasanikbacteria bacterium]
MNTLSPEQLKEKIIEQLQTVIDPHIGIDIWTLGFIYNIDVKEDTAVHILMTLTTPMCPLESTLKQDISDALAEIGITTLTMQTTFDPPWQPPQKVREMFAR